MTWIFSISEMWRAQLKFIHMLRIFFKANIDIIFKKETKIFNFLKFHRFSCSFYFKTENKWFFWSLHRSSKKIEIVEITKNLKTSLKAITPL